MKVTETKLEKLIPYARNPRKNGGAVDAVAGQFVNLDSDNPSL